MKNLLQIIEKINKNHNLFFLVIVIFSLGLTFFAHQFIISRKWVELGDYKLYYFLLLMSTHIINTTILASIYYFEKTGFEKFQGTKKFLWRVFIFNTLGIIALSCIVYWAKFRNTGEMTIPVTIGAILTMITIPLQAIYFFIKSLRLFFSKKTSIYHILLMLVFSIISISCLIYPIHAIGNFWGGGVDFM